MNILSAVKTMQEKVFRLRETINMPLYKNGLALVTSLIVTSGLGIFYWALAARQYSPEAVGINSALISTMGFLTNLAQFGLVNFLIRYIPRAGKNTPKLILFSYLFSVSLSILATIIFVIGVKLWAPSLQFLHEPRMFVWFLLTTMFWCVFALQDGVLTGLGRATWVPVENTFFALSKMGLLALFAKTFVDYGIFYSWASPIFLINIVVTTILFKVVIPKHVKETEADAETQGFRQILQFVGGDYLSAMVWNASTSFIPLLIIERLGAEANAYFYFPWLIAYSLYMVSRNLGMSLTVEAAKDQARLSEFSRRSLKHSLTLLIPMVLVAIVGSRLILEIFGHQYSLEGEVLLRYLALSAIPYSIISLYVSIARVQRKILHMMAALSSMSILSVILTFLWIDPYGLQGVGLAWLVGQSSVAIVLLFTGLRTFLFGSKMVEDVSKNVAKT